MLRFTSSEMKRRLRIGEARRATSIHKRREFSVDLNCASGAPYFLGTTESFIALPSRNLSVVLAGI